MTFELKSRWALHRIIVAFAVIAAPVSLPTQAQSGLINKLSESIGLNVDHVAVKVAELPEKSRRLFVQGLDFSPDGNQIAAALDLSDINIWDWKKKSVLQALKKLPSTTSDARRQVLYSPDGKLLAACHNPGEHNVSMRIWETRTWSIVKDIDNSEIAGLGCVDMEFTPDGKNLFRAPERTGSRGELVAYDTSSWQVAWNMPFHDFSGKTIAVNPSGNLIAVGGDQLITVPESATYPLGVRGDRLLRIIDIKQRKVVSESKGGAFNSLEWSPDGARMAVATSDYIYILDTATSQNISFEALKIPQVAKIMFSPNGKYLLEGFFDGRGGGLGLNIWNSQRSKLLQHIDGDISTFAISKDGHYLAVGELGRTSIWQFSH